MLDLIIIQKRIRNQHYTTYLKLLIVWIEIKGMLVAIVVEATVLVVEVEVVTVKVVMVVVVQ